MFGALHQRMAVERQRHRRQLIGHDQHDVHGMPAQLMPHFESPGQEFPASKDCQADRRSVKDQSLHVGMSSTHGKPARSTPAARACRVRGCGSRRRLQRRRPRSRHDPVGRQPSRGASGARARCDPVPAGLARGHAHRCRGCALRGGAAWILDHRRRGRRHPHRRQAPASDGGHRFRLRRLLAVAAPRRAEGRHRRAGRAYRHHPEQCRRGPRHRRRSPSPSAPACGRASR